MVVEILNPERKSCGFKISGVVWTGPKGLGPVSRKSR